MCRHSTSPPRTRVSRKTSSEPKIQMVSIQDTTWNITHQFKYYQKNVKKQQKKFQNLLSDWFRSTILSFTFSVKFYTTPPLAMLLQQSHVWNQHHLYKCRWIVSSAGNQFQSFNWFRNWVPTTWFSITTFPFFGHLELLSLSSVNTDHACGIFLLILSCSY